MSKPDLIVLRPAPGIKIPKSIDGWWYDRLTINATNYCTIICSGLHEYIARPTGRFEIRDDGAIAEVWEVEVNGRQ